MQTLEIRCFGCEDLLRKFKGDASVEVVKAVGQCCAHDFKLPQAACYPKVADLE